MSASCVIVLKFGGSVLQGYQDLHRAAQEIYRWRRAGYQVVAVVSAIGDATNQLSRQASESGGLDDRKTALLLATGELQSASLLGLALDRAGISSSVCDDTAARLKTRGPVLDAQLVDVDAEFLQRKLQQSGVVVLPGFIGRGESAEMTLLGRGGSDLTALFVAARLSARCRLVKDVDGLYEYDPKQDRKSPRRYRTINYCDALKLDESIVQHKAVRFAETSGLTFEVASLGAACSTQVGNFEASDLSQVTHVAANEGVRQPLRVALLGTGTVGLGVFRQLRKNYSDEVQVVSVATRDHDKAIRAGVPAELLATTTEEAVDCDCDVVIELVGGIAGPEQWISEALKQGKHVITANKALLAEQATALEQLADKHGVTLTFSAAVGGSVPMLETVHRLAQANPVREVLGTLNGSTNFVLDEIACGVSFEEAVAKAGDLGLTERDPYRDLGGVDAAEKLVLLARKCGFQIKTDEIARQDLSAEVIRDLDLKQGETIRQVGRLLFDSQQKQVRGSVVIRRLPADSIFSSVTGAGNILQVHCQTGATVTVHGQGAGRWPTTAAVVADLLDLTALHRKELANRFNDGQTQLVGS